MSNIWVVGASVLVMPLLWGLGIQKRPGGPGLREKSEGQPQLRPGTRVAPPCANFQAPFPPTRPSLFVRPAWGHNAINLPDPLTNAWLEPPFIFYTSLTSPSRQKAARGDHRQGHGH